MVTGDRSHKTRVLRQRYTLFLRFPRLGSVRPLPRTDLEKTKMLPDEKSHDLGTRRESFENKMTYYFFISRRLWVK